MNAKDARRISDSYNSVFFDEKTFDDIISHIKVCAQSGETRCRYTLPVPNSDAAKPYVDKLKELGFESYTMYPPRLERDYSKSNSSMSLYVRW